MSNLVLVTEIAVDEVALEGLDGLTIESFWVRMAERMNWPLPLSDKVKQPIWSFVVRQDCFRFFRLLQPRPLIRTFVRGNRDSMEDMVDCPYTVYERNEIELENGKLRGSCQDFATRELIAKESLRALTLAEVMAEYGDHLVIVGSQQIREAAIIPRSCSKFFVLTLQQYCLLERIGRARWNGETTIGRYHMDEGNFFHVRKNLLEFKMICKQPYMERSSEGSNTGLMLHLPRFYRTYKPVQMLMIEHIAETVKRQPNCLMEYPKVGEIFEESAFPILRKMYKSPMFVHFFETDIRVPYRQIYPDATPAQYKMRHKECERTLRVMRLRNADLNIQKMWPQDADDDGSDNEGHLDQSRVRLDMPVLEHAYHVLDAKGCSGMTQKQLAEHLGLSKLNARVLIRNLERLKYISTYAQDIGRQRVTTYYVSKYKASQDQSFKDNTNVSLIDSVFKQELVQSKTVPPPIAELDIKLESETEAITATDLEAAFGVPEASPEKKYTPPAHVELSEDLHINAVQVKVKELDAPLGRKKKKAMKTITRDKITVRMANRMNIIEQTLQHCRVLEDFAKVFSILLSEERRMGYEDEMCRRSIHRIIDYMKKENKLRLYLVKFSLKDTHSQLMFICETSVEENNPLMLSMIEKEKFKFLLRINNERTRLKQMRAAVVKEDAQTPADNHTPSTDAPPATASAPAPSTAAPLPDTRKRKAKKEAANADTNDMLYGLTPKFHKIRTLHEFLYYLVYDYTSSPQVIHPDDAIPLWKTTEPLVNYSELLPEMPTIYSREINWKMFVPPITSYPPYVERGWVLFSDALLRLPLSIYISISNIYFEVAGLQEFLNHPIRKHYLLSYIPIAIQNQLLDTRKHIFYMSEVMKRAATLGLVQYGPQRQKDKTQVFIYLNRRASLVDTIISKPGAFHISDEDYPVNQYTFNTTADVTSYWCDMHRICNHTRLGKRMLTNYVSLRWDYQPSLIATWRSQSRESILNNDLGRIPGDGRGAAGLDSTLFSHMVRNWALQRKRLRKAKVPSAKPKKPTRIVRSQVRKRRLTVTEQPTTSTRPAAAPTKIVPIKRITNRRFSTMNITVKLTKKRGRQQIYDDVDKQALRRMVKLRVDWSREEDDLLLLCRAAIQVISPSTRKVNISSQHVRDILHWTLKSYDKTSRACQRRIVFMLKKESVARNVFLLVKEILQNRQLAQRFNAQTYGRLRKQIPEETHFQHAFYTQFVELVHLLKVQGYTVHGQSKSVAERLLPGTLDELHARYHTKTETYTLDRLKYEAPTTWTDIETTVICGLIHSSCCCVRDKTSWNIQLYEIYKNYPDWVLAAAMAKVRDGQLISANKLHASSRGSVKTLPLSASPFHLSATYKHSMQTRIPVRLLEDAWRWYNVMEASAGCPGGLQLRRIDGGCVVLMAELFHDRPHIRVDVTIPSTVLIFDTSKCPENKVLLERINNRFRSIFEFVQNDNKQKLCQANVVSAPAEVVQQRRPPASRVRRVTISTDEHRTIEYFVSPVERLMKMNEVMYHFYCVLGQLGERTTVARITVDADHRCPFDCVLAQPNPVARAVEIIRRKADCLFRISEDDQMELSLVQGEFELSVWNVLSVFNALVNHRFGVGADEADEEGEVVDHGMLQVSTDILRNDADPSGSHVVDMGGEESATEVRTTAEAPPVLVPKEEEADGDVDDMLDDTNGDKVYKMHDYFFLNPCRLTLVLDRPEDMMHADQVAKQALLDDVSSECVWSTSYTDDAELREGLSTDEAAYSQRAMEVMEFLEQKAELGATNVELVARFPDRPVLLRCLDALQRMRMILRSGVVEITFIHGKFTKPWLVQTYNMKRLQRESVVPVPFQLIQVSEATPSTSSGRKRRHSRTLSSANDADSPEKKPLLRASRSSKVTLSMTDTLAEPNSKVTFQIIPKPWIRINGSLNRRVLDRWMGVILTHCISHPGHTLEALMRRFSMLVPMHARDLVTYLQRLDTIRLMAVRQTAEPASIWSTYEQPDIVPATDLDDNQSVFIEVLPQAITRFILFIGEKQYKAEFI